MKKVFLFFIVFIVCFPLVAQDSLNMKKMAVLSGMGVDYNDVWGYRLGSKEFAVIGSNSAINIVDVTDCGNPVLEHQWVDGSSVIWRDFKDYGDYIYGVCDGGSSSCNEGLQVINKNTFAQSQSLAHFRSAHNIFIEKESGRLYIVDANTNRHGLIVFDIKTDPANPILLKIVNFRDITNNQSGDYRLHDIYVLNDTAYCSNGYSGYRIWDMVDLEDVSLITEFDNSNGYNHSSWKHPNAPYLYVAEEVPIGKPIYVYDISDIQDPFTTYSFKDPLEEPDYDNNRPHNPFVLRDRLYISYYHDGIQVYDVSDPELPERIAYYDTYPDNNGNGYSGFQGAWGVYPFLPSGCILASDITYGLNTLELTLTPEPDNSMSSGNIIIDNAARGMVFRTIDDQYVRVVVNNQTKLELTTLGGIPDDKIEFGNSNLKFDSNLNGIIMKNPNGDYIRVGIADDGSLDLSHVGILPTNAITLADEDLYFAHIRGGLKMKSPGGLCFHYTVADVSVEEITEVSCD